MVDWIPEINWAVLIAFLTAIGVVLIPLISFYKSRAKDRLENFYSPLFSIVKRIEARGVQASYTYNPPHMMAGGAGLEWLNTVHLEVHKIVNNHSHLASKELRGLLFTAINEQWVSMHSPKRERLRSLIELEYDQVCTEYHNPYYIVYRPVESLCSRLCTKYRKIREKLIR